MSVGFFYNYKKRDALSGEKVLYHGTWNDRSVVFDRMFRGYRFRPEECEALCNGEMLHVFGLSRGGTTYGVLGALTEPNRKQFVKTDDEDALLLEFKVFDVLVDDPEYDFLNRTVMFLDDYLAQQDDLSDVDDFVFVSYGLDEGASVAGSVLDSFSDKSDAEMSAMIAYQDEPKIKPTKYVVHDNVRVFVPVYIGVPGFDPDYEKNKDIDFVELADREDALELALNTESEVDSNDGLGDVGEVVSGFGFDFDTGEETVLPVLNEDVSFDSDDAVMIDENLDSEQSDDFADLEYADESEMGIMYDPLADEPYDPEESEIITDYDEE